MTPMTRLLHLSDTHFGTERPVVMKALQRLCAQWQPSLAVLSGDVTQRARPAQFGDAADFLRSLNIPATMVLPGNHDIPLFNLVRRLTRPYADYQASFGYALETEHSDPHWLVLSVNTTRWYRHKNGEIDPQQIRTVANRLRQASPGQVRVVVTHHPLAVTEETDQGNQPRRHRQALAAWAQAGVDLVLGGHIHLPFVTPVEPLGQTGVPIEAGAIRPRRVWAVQAGTATSTRLREGIPNSVHLISCGSHRHGRVCQIETWQFDLESAAFRSVAQRELALSL